MEDKNGQDFPPQPVVFRGVEDCREPLLHDQDDWATCGEHLMTAPEWAMMFKDIPSPQAGVFHVYARE